MSVVILGEKLVCEHSLELAKFLSVANRARLPVIYLSCLIHNLTQLGLDLDAFLILQLSELGQNFCVIFDMA